MSDFETINTTNGNLILNFPLGGAAPGRGAITGAMSLRYNSKLYDSQVAVLSDHSNQLTPQNYLVQTDEGGWHLTSTLNYTIKIVNRADVEDGPAQCTPDGGLENKRAVYVWKLKVVYPDGAEREFRPAGYSDILGDGYFNVNPSTGELRDVTANGGREGSCLDQRYGFASNPLTYFSTDGTYTRLVVNRGVDWTLSFPDGARAVGSAAQGFSGAQYLYDRNNNYITYGSVTLPNGHVAGGIVDQFGRYVVMDSADTNEDYFYSLGFNNQIIMWTVRWKDNHVVKPYETTPVSSGRTRGTTSSQTFQGESRVVDRITLPSQAGNLSYQFSYNAPDDPIDPPTNSNGWGEVSGVILPSGAQIAYEYDRDATHPVDFRHPARPSTRQVLDNAVSKKTVAYQAEYEGTSSPVTEVWTYHISRSGSTVVGPDGGQTIQLYNDTSSPRPDAGLVLSETYPNGEIIERTWQSNQPSATTGFDTAYPSANFYVKREFHSIPNAVGTLVWTSIKEYDYDKNGNVTRESDYDWVPYSTAHGGGGVFPFGLTPSRIVINAYKNATVNAENNTTEQSNAYWNALAPRVRNLPAASEVRDGSGLKLARAEFAYDDPNTTANLIGKSSWDSSKGIYSNPLLSSNSITVSTQYNQYGMPTLTTDAKGNQTRIFYGLIGAVSDLYPTEINTAYGTSVQRTQDREYDFATGLVTRATDADNGVTTSTTYDVFGRPTLVKAAEGKAEETHTSTEYSDTYRRVIVRSDLTAKDDGKLVGIQHYDQLGRIRLARQLEDSTTQSAIDETQGIKVQTRYLLSGSNSYQYLSNPYRANYSSNAGAEVSMGWTRSKSDNSGRLIEVQTFGGAGIPGPWGSSSTSTGSVTTAYDANFTTVTDQSGRVRRSITDGLGRLTRVDEPDTNGNLGAIDSPAQPTSYTYDALGNLRQVVQGEQQRSFMYDSLSRLIRARNPEQQINSNLGTTDPITNNGQWCMSYDYDENGSLLRKTDARGAVSNYIYDQLNRITGRTYTDGTPAVAYSYDPNIANGKGRLSSVSSSVSTYTYSSYDAMGRVLSGSQTLSSQTGSQTYTMSYGYNISGQLTSIKYPSGHGVNYNYDNAGRLADKDSTHPAFSGNLGDNIPRTYASAIVYDTASRMTQEQLGTTIPIYNKLFYNVRGQLAEIREGTTANDTGWNRGAIINHYSDNYGCWGASCNAPDNNGNLMKQEVYVPGDDQISSYTMRWQQYDYDNLNRINWVRETAGGTEVWRQTFVYDRFGNRTIDSNNTTTGIPGPQFTVTASNNRLGVPNGQSGTMAYDAAGNLTTDTYSAAAVNRAYDAENRMTSETTYNSVVAGAYGYDGDGRRVIRTVNGVTTWQVYGMGGELLAEYAQNASPASPQKEYGFRNGQLLITTEAGTASAFAPSALSATPPTSGASMNISWTAASGATNYRVERKAAGGSFVSIGTTASTSITDNGAGSGSAYLYKVCAADGAGNCTSSYSNIALGATVTFLTDPNIVSIADDPTGAGVTTPKAAHVNELRVAVNAVRALAGLPAATSPNVAAAATIRVEDIRDLRTKLDEALTALGIQTSAYTDATLKGFAEDPLNATPIKAVHIRELRQRAKSGTGGSGGGSGGTSFSIHWLIADQLGTPRMIFDQSGSLATVSRHDYLPFGEELFAGTGGRTAALGYTNNDGARQKFTSKERDNETGLDYFGARYYASTQGRFISVDPSRVSIHAGNPQTWNRYSYTYNNPLVMVDDNGKWPTWIHEKIIDAALPLLSSAQRKEIKEGSYSVDNPRNGGQDTSHANEHGMAKPGQSREKAAEGADQFINTNVDNAQTAKQYHGLTSSLWDFGRAFHTVSDMTSPSHEDYQTWRLSGAASHVWGESDISYYRLGLAVGATLELYKYTYGSEELKKATGYEPGSYKDPTIRSLREREDLPGMGMGSSSEDMYEYRLGLTRGLRFDFHRQRTTPPNNYDYESGH
jgi:RHS repeat-associated protein